MRVKVHNKRGDADSHLAMTVRSNVIARNEATFCNCEPERRRRSGVAIFFNDRFYAPSF